VRVKYIIYHVWNDGRETTIATKSTGMGDRSVSRFSISCLVHTPTIAIIECNAPGSLEMVYVRCAANRLSCCCAYRRTVHSNWSRLNAMPPTPGVMQQQQQTSAYKTRSLNSLMDAGDTSQSQPIHFGNSTRCRVRLLLDNMESGFILDVGSPTGLGCIIAV